MGLDLRQPRRGGDVLLGVEYDRLHAQAMRAARDRQCSKPAAEYDELANHRTPDQGVTPNASAAMWMSPEMVEPVT
jgi:hypothetical protein